MTTLLRALGVAGLVLLGPLAARAATPTDTLRDFFTRANVVIQAPEEQMSVEERIARIRQMANAVFDARRAAAEALGTEWQVRTPAEQAQFTDVFGDTLQRAYLSRVGAKVKVSGGVGVTFLDEAVQGEAAVVRTTLATRTNGVLSVDYRMTRTGDTWTVIDALVDGVSLVGTYRAQFGRVLQGYSYADLVEMLRAVAPESARPGVAIASEAVKPGDDARVMAVVPTAEGAPPPPVEGPPAAAAPAVSQAPAAGSTPAPGAEGAVATPSGHDTRLAHAPVPEGLPSAAALTAGRFWVDIGAFGSPELVANVLAHLSDPAIAIFTPPSPGRAESLTRVLVGPFADRGAAAAKARELEGAGYRGVVAEP